MKRWTEEETEILINSYTRGGAKMAIKALPQKSKNAILNRAYRLGIRTPRYYSEEEANFVKKMYPKKGAAWCAKKIGRSYESVRTWAGLHGLKYRQWTDDEIEFLAEHADKDNKTLAKKLKKSRQAITLARRRYEIGTHVDNMTDMPLSEAGRLLGINPRNLYYTLVHKYKTTKNGHNRLISFKELERFMRENPRKWDATRSEKEYFMQYEWFRQKRQEDLQRMRERRAQ